MAKGPQRNINRPAELREFVFNSANRGFVQWVKMAREKLPGIGRWVNHWEATGYEVLAEPMTAGNPRTKVVRGDLVQLHADDSVRIILELLEAIHGVDSLNLKFGDSYSFATAVAIAIDTFSNGQAFTLSGGPAVEIHNLNFRIPVFQPVFLRQTKARRSGIILFGVKRTRSNKDQFAKFRVPHK